ncbi:hypothetical protein SprV_0802523800 [Sparganum proliferum]
MNAFVIMYLTIVPMLWMTWGQQTGTQNGRLVCEHMTAEPIVNTFQWLLARRLQFKEPVLLPDCVHAVYGRLMTFFLNDPIRCDRALIMLDGNVSMYQCAADILASVQTSYVLVRPHPPRSVKIPARSQAKRIHANFLLVHQKQGELQKLSFMDQASLSYRSNSFFPNCEESASNNYTLTEAEINVMATLWAVLESQFPYECYSFVRSDDGNDRFDFDL